MSYKKQELFSLRDNQSSPPVYLVGSVLLIFLVFCVVSLFCASLLPVLGQMLSVSVEFVPGFKYWCSFCPIMFLCS